MIDNFDSTDNSLSGLLPETVDKARDSTRMLGVSTTVFAKAISKAFTDAAAGGKHFDDVLKQLALRLSGMDKCSLAAGLSLARAHHLRSGTRAGWIARRDCRCGNADQHLFQRWPRPVELS